MGLWWSVECSRMFKKFKFCLSPHRQQSLSVYQVTECGISVSVLLKHGENFQMQNPVEGRIKNITEVCYSWSLD